MATVVSSRSRKIDYGALAFLLVAANLRPALTNIGPLLHTIRTDLGLSGTAAGLLTALPLPILAGFAPFARLGLVLGIERTIAGCLALIAGGLALRSQGSAVALFAGTAVFAVGIGIANVLMPSVIKRDYPDHVAGMTTAYVMVISLAGAVATGISVPLSDYLAGGWQTSLAVWAIFAVVALAVWLPQARKSADAVVVWTKDVERAGKPIWRSALAWQVTFFMGLQFLIFYVMVSWIPSFLVDRGETRASAGWDLTLYQVAAFSAGFVAPWLVQQSRDQRAVAVSSCLVTALATSGLLLAPRLAAAWLFILGVSFGISFILSFAFIAMRADDHRRAASLSTLSQGVAYLVAAAGAPAMGWLHDLTRQWTAPMACLVVIALLQAIVGYGAGRNQRV